MRIHSVADMNLNGLASVGTPLYSVTLPRDLDWGSSKASDIVFTGAHGTPCSSPSNSALVNSPILSWTIPSTSSLFSILTLFSFQDGGTFSERASTILSHWPLVPTPMANQPSDARNTYMVRDLDDGSPSSPSPSLLAHYVPDLPGTKLRYPTMICLFWPLPLLYFA